MVSQQEKLAQLQSSIKDRPNNVAALKEFGALQAEMGEWSRAMGAYREALLISPNDRDAKIGYGEAQLGLGDFQGALDTGTSIGGNTLQVQQLRAGALAGLSRFDEARAILDALHQSHPRNLDVRSNLALVMGLQRDPAAYGIARAAAFAPDAEFTHVRNLVLIGGMVQNDSAARSDAAQLGLASDEVGEILAVGRRARTQGMSAFGVIS
ncbi:hypothetical protein JJJ17_00215 [Paracoccus caeni]|uniref:Tetratricopeptide repeat protein n=1 Tax=Paracoccus caeni TaxID=657651 RepID=A0A934VYK4_9RHOB|nr:hypothetical protein [Paracoccus caeni]MBK4214338.1 hypothetical protein [Paracoccus caeni]